MNSGGTMLTKKYKNFIEKTSTNLIKSYEKATNKIMI